MDKNYDNAALILAIVGICIASLNWLVAVGILPLFFIFIPMLISGLSMIGLILGILSLKTSEHKWKPTLAIVIYITTLVINMIFMVPLTMRLYNELFSSLLTFSY